MEKEKVVLKEFKEEVLKEFKEEEDTAQECDDESEQSVKTAHDTSKRLRTALKLEAHAFCRTDAACGRTLRRRTANHDTDDVPSRKREQIAKQVTQIVLSAFPLSTYLDL